MKASNAASASLFVSAIQISCNDRLAFGCWLFGSLLRTLAVLCTQGLLKKALSYARSRARQAAIAAAIEEDSRVSGVPDHIPALTKHRIQTNRARRAAA